MHLNIKMKEDLRTLKAGQEYNFDFSKRNWFMIVGNNGCGKSTLLNILRDYKCDNLDDRTCGDYSAKLGYEEIRGFKNKAEIDTNFEKFYFISSEFDDPRSLDNCASAEALIKHGGYQTKRMSNGQRSLTMLAMWLEENKKEWDDKTLLIFDEADKGFGVKYQVGLMRMLTNLNSKLGVKSIIVSHHSLPILLTDELFWFEQRKMIPADLYLTVETGYKFTLPKYLYGDKDGIHAF